MAEHTPTPWRLCTTGNLGSAIEGPSGKTYYDGDDGYRIVASYQECTASPLYAVQEANRLANGAFIIKAVNNHEALVKVLERSRSQHREDGIWETHPLLIEIDRVLADVGGSRE